MVLNVIIATTGLVLPSVVPQLSAAPVLQNEKAAPNIGRYIDRLEEANVFPTTSMLAWTPTKEFKGFKERNYADMPTQVAPAPQVSPEATSSESSGYQSIPEVKFQFDETAARRAALERAAQKPVTQAESKPAPTLSPSMSERSTFSLPSLGGMEVPKMEASKMAMPKMAMPKMAIPKVEMPDTGMISSSIRGTAESLSLSRDDAPSKSSLERAVPSSAVPSSAVPSSTAPSAASSQHDEAVRVDTSASALAGKSVEELREDAAQLASAAQRESERLLAAAQSQQEELLRSARAEASSVRDAASARAAGVRSEAHKAVEAAESALRVASSESASAQRELASARASKVATQAELDKTFVLNFGRKGELKEELKALDMREKGASKAVDGAAKALAKAEAALDAQRTAANKQEEIALKIVTDADKLAAKIESDGAKRADEAARDGEKASAAVLKAADKDAGVLKRALGKAANAAKTAAIAR